MIDKDCAQAADLIEAAKRANLSPEVAAELYHHAEQLHVGCAIREAMRMQANDTEGLKGTLPNCDCHHKIGANHGQPRA